MWSLIFLFANFMNIMGFIYPFLLKFDVRINVIKLKGKIKIIIFNKLKFELKFRIKNGYIYIYNKKKERKEKLTKKNINFLFIFNLLNQLYFRQQVLNLDVISNFGYNLDSCITATGCGFIDVFTKGLLSKIKNNKKSAHIFTRVEPKYNEDILNVRLVHEIRMSFADILYSIFYAIIITGRDYEGSRKNILKQKQKNRITN